MKAVYFETHGEIDVLRFGDVPDPVPSAGQVLVRVRACALNFLDIWVRRGWPGLKTGSPDMSQSVKSGSARSSFSVPI